MSSNNKLLVVYRWPSSVLHPEKGSTKTGMYVGHPLYSPSCFSSCRGHPQRCTGVQQPCLSQINRRPWPLSLLLLSLELSCSMICPMPAANNVAYQDS